MTTGDETKARELLTNAKALLLDFDGPICSVFAGIPASTVAEQLRIVLADGGHTELPETIATTNDPFDVFRYAATLGDNEAHYVEAAFTALEVEAIASAEPTPGAHEFMEAWRNTSRPLAVVSNNSTIAIETYLTLYGFGQLVEFVSARSTSDPTLLKPNPYLLDNATSALAVEPQACVFVGDSVSDVKAANRVGMPVVGFANKDGKQSQLRITGADATVDDLTTLNLTNRRF